MGRQKAYEILRKSSQEAFLKNCSLKEILLRNEEVSRYLSQNGLEKTMNYQNYIGLSAEKTNQIIEKWRSFLK